MLAGLDLALLGQFALTCVIIEITPGPNMAWLAVTSAAKGRRAGLMAVAGVATGLAVIGIAAAFGLAALISASPVLWNVLRWGGVAWLLYLAWEAWTDADGVVEATDSRTWFNRGLITNLLNPKAAVFYVAMLPGFLIPTAPVLPQTLILTAVFVVIATSIHAGIVLASGTMSYLLTDPVRSGRIRRTLAVLLALVALWFAWSTRASGGG
jgi:threonine/homoserine/homoserine lactone efflux protein